MGKPLKTGDSIMIRGEGMPIYKNPDQKGQLYVVFEVDMPDEEWCRTVDRTVSNRSAHALLSKFDFTFLRCNTGPRSSVASR